MKDADTSTAAATRRGGWQPRAIIALAVVWVLLWDRVTLGNVVNGLIIGAVVAGSRGSIAAVGPLVLLAVVALAWAAVRMIRRRRAKQRTLPR